MKYIVTSFNHEDEIEIRTNNIITALDAFFTSTDDGIHTHIVDGTTGEVLAVANAPDDEPHYATDEMALMMAGYLVAIEQNMAEEEEAECIDCECKDIAPVGLLEMLDALVAEGKAVKLPS